MAAIFPSRSDYETLIRRLDVFAADPAIKTGKVLMRKDGLFPQAYSGGRAVVFPVLIESRKYAIKCWIQSLGALEERYQSISRLIQSSKPPYLIESVYREKELLFNGSRYPVLQMQWSESRTLKEWISAHINDSSLLSELAQRFLEVVADMHSMNMSHGDLQHENILISDSSAITLVDYDSIYLKGLDHLDDEVKGLPGFQHPSRSRQAKASPKSDYLSEYVIYITLLALSRKPDLWRQAQDHNRLLFSQEDLCNPRSSSLFRDIKSIDGLSELIEAFQSQCLCPDLSNITPIESIVTVPKSSSPPKERKQATARTQSPTTSHNKASGSAKDLRKAKTWESNQDSTSEWIFTGFDQETNSENPVHSSHDTSPVSGSKKQSSTGNRSDARSCANNSNTNSTPPPAGNYEPDAASSSGSHAWPSVATPKHVVEGYLSSQNITSLGLASISFESLFIRLICFTAKGSINELLISKERIIGWRGIGCKLELVTSNLLGGTDVLTISAPHLSDTRSISRIINALKDAGISDVWPSGYSANSPTSDSASNQSTRRGDQSNVYRPANNQYGEPEWRFTSYRPFAYATVDDIAYCTGAPRHVVSDVAKNLNFNPPFNLIEADRIAYSLVGDCSIRRAYNSRHSSKYSSMGNPDSSTETISSDSVSNQTQVKNVGRTSERQANQSSSRLSEERIFSYSTVDDIAYCTAKQHSQVLSAANKLKVHPPFTLIEADRIAGLLLGDSSIRRAFMKTTNASRSNVQVSTERGSVGKSVAVRSTVSSSSVSSREAESQNPHDQDLPNTKSSSVPAGGLANGNSKTDCFVATAIYETDCHPELSILRDYRDRVLLSSRLGRHFVSWYYKVGPAIARVIVRAKLSPKLRPLMSIVVNHLPSGK